MTIDKLIVLVLFGLTALNWTIHWYTQVVTYRLFPAVERRMSGEDFVGYHRDYQSRLIWAIYVPWSLLMATSLAAVLAPPTGWGPIVWALFALNAAIGVISVALAVPVHARIDRTAQLTDADASGLMRANLWRLIAASVSLLLCGILAFRVLAGGA